MEQIYSQSCLLAVVLICCLLLRKIERDTEKDTENIKHVFFFFLQESY